MSNFTLSFFAEFWEFLRVRKKWWLAPIVIMLALLGALIVICSLLGACAEFKQAGRTIGHTSRDVAREIGHGTRDAAKVIGKGTKRVVTEATAPTEDEEPTDD